jgi:tetratricopeptide (TPR) repeat protein
VARFKKGGKKMETRIIKGKVVAEPAKEREIIAVAPEEVQNHLEWGKALFKNGHYEEALTEFEAVLRTAPGSIETRVWIRKAKEALAQPEVELAAEAEAAPATEAVKAKECVWMKLGLVSHRICTNNYDCLTCEFDQMMQEQMAKGDTAELDAAMERFKKLPGNQRICRYALRGDISYRLCTRLFQCATCEFAQNMEDATQRKLDKINARRDALLKKTA